MIAELMEPCNIMHGLRVNVIGIDIAVQALNLSPVLRNFQPAHDHRLVHLEMKLKSVNTALIAEGLIDASQGRCQVKGAARNIESIAMPLKNFFSFFELTD